MILWCDLETTGLDSSRDRILEVGMILTDDRFEPLRSFHAVIDSAKHVAFADMHPKVQTMHMKNGLWLESLQSNNDFVDIAKDMVDWLIPGLVGTPILAGNTVSFDRRFLEEYMPHFAARLHYRSLDVTAFNELAMRVRAFGSIYAGRPMRPADANSHRAMPDIEHSLRTLEYYVNAFKPSTNG